MAADQPRRPSCRADCFSIFSFAVVGLAHSHSILASAPLIVAALSVPLLGEHVGWRRWCAIFVGFIGVLVILKPDGEGFDNRLLITFIAAFMLALYSVLTRLGSKSDSAMTSFFIPAWPVRQH